MVGREWLPIWESRPYPPLLMSLVVDSTVSGFKKIFPQSEISQGIVHWKNRSNTYLYLDSEIRATVKLLFDFALSDSGNFLRFFKVAYKKSVQFNNDSKLLKANNLKVATNQELLKYLDDFCRDFFDFYQYATIASWFGYNQKNPLYGEMNNIVLKKTKNQPEKFADYLIILTNPPKPLKTAQLDLALFMLAAKAKSKKLVKSSQIKKYFFDQLSVIYQQYSFLSFDFTSQIGWDIDYFAKQVEQKTKLDIGQEIDRIKNYELTNNKQYHDLCNHLDLTKAEIKIFNLIRNIGYYKWLREYEFQEGLLNYSAVIDELGRRLGLNNLASRYIFPNEWPVFLNNNKSAKAVVSRRMKCCFYLSRYKKRPILLEGKEALASIKRLKVVKGELSSSAELKGTPAFSGIVQGKVKIINTSKDLAKMGKGDILVSISTSPDLLPAMVKASGIITDEGGIVCHAAIVSRELKIPCIVGTKIATKVLKDGDKVEVDANKGIIKKI